ncbi:hypothetical protein Avbf_01479 [Armadillidium vulgare]|nr:hypothetical protein Avbf_01479 [Armadillidium vulgare]
MYCSLLNHFSKGIDNEENVPYSALVGEVGLVDSIICNGAESQNHERSCNCNGAESQDHERSCNCNGAKSQDHERSCNCNGAESQDHERSCNNSEPGHEDVRDNADCSNRSESSHTSALGKVAKFII